jgi:hypothetical protein
MNGFIDRNFGTMIAASKPKEQHQMNLQTFEQAAVAINIAQDRRTQLEEELRALRIHIKRLEKLKAKEENSEQIRAESIVMSIQRELSADGKRLTLEEVIQVAVRKVGARDAASIKKAFEGVKIPTATPSAPTEPAQMSVPPSILPGAFPPR